MGYFQVYLWLIDGYHGYHFKKLPRMHDFLSGIRRYQDMGGAPWLYGGIFT
jgi:hypothetical protein